MKEVFNATIIAKKLIGKKSITPDDGGCQEYIKNELLEVKLSLKISILKTSKIFG